MARILSADGRPDGPYIKTLVIMGKDVCAVKALDVDLSLARFKTDSAISGNSGDIRERVLEKWEPSNDDPSLDSINDQSQQLGNWDQFAVNEKLFGVTTDFEESIYTTILDKSGPNFKKKEAEAIRVANEILRSATSNTHMAEERGHVTDSTGQDEEVRYSSVLRNVSGKQAPAFQAAKKSSSIRTTAQVTQPRPHDKSRAMPTNPQKARSSHSIAVSSEQGSISQIDNGESAPAVKNVWNRGNKSNQPVAASASTILKRQSSDNSEKIATSSGRSMATLTSQQKSAPAANKKYADVANSRGEIKKVIDSSSSARPVDTNRQAQVPHNNATLSSKPNIKAFNGILDRESNLKADPNRPSSIIMSDQPAVPVAKAFSKFAIKEREQRLLEKKKEIGAVISDLKSFSATFKLRTPVPADLQELFSKNKAITSSVPSIGAVKKVVELPVKQISKPPTISKAQSPLSPTGSSFKFNVKASVFKPNPNAIAFVPVRHLINLTMKAAAPVQPIIEKIPFFGTKKLNKTPISITSVFIAGFQKNAFINSQRVSTSWPGSLNVSYQQAYHPQQMHHPNMGPLLPMGMPISFEEQQIIYDQNGYAVPPFYQVPYGYPRPMGRGFPLNPPFLPYGPPPPSMYHQAGVPNQMYTGAQQP